MRSAFRLCKLAALCLVLVGMASPAVRGAIVNPSGGLTTPRVEFLNVSESSGTDPTPLYGSATFVDVGLDERRMVFQPKGFVAYGTCGTCDLTDGQLNFSLATTPMTTDPTVINEIRISEFGDYLVAGQGTAATSVAATFAVRLLITEIDGVLLTNPVSIPVHQTTSAALAGNPPILLQPWAQDEVVSIRDALIALNIPFVHGATKIDVVIDDMLTAQSEAATLAFIAKKGFTVQVDTVQAPEPGTVALVLVALCNLTWYRRCRM